ncbi:unnamed protein product [Phytophthora fragariaefolia]|uniref:Unnamed protein product n=1 Tax=Phytophthora fragariaefolia TaxID=1490495 RepID=A0A9W6X5Z5_9STRA|nr:unnamed protein product [Phytophthora fragariaefolia]
MADEVEALRREVEALKLQLERERRKNAAAQAAAGDRPQLKPERVKAQRGGGAKPRGGDAKPVEEQRVYVQHVAVGARRGKWWLRDRQVLSRAVSKGGGATLKVRESWVWSGRTVVLDKIVRLDEQQEPQEQETRELEQQLNAVNADVTSEVLAIANAVAAASEGGALQEQPPSAAETSEAASTSDVAVEQAAKIEAAPPTPTKEDSVSTAEPPPAPAADSVEAQ